MNDRTYWNTAGPTGGRGDITQVGWGGGGRVVSVKHMPAGTQAAILRAVVHERHPKLALPAIASRFGVTYDDVRQVIDRHGYPENAKMRAAAAQLELQEQQTPPKPQADPFTLGLEQVAEEKLGGDSGIGTYDGPRTDVEPTSASQGDDVGQLMRVRVADIHLDPDNLRAVPHETDEDIIELADSIAKLGLLQPITVRRHDSGHLVIVMGHRRYVAVRRLKWTSVPVIVRGAMLPSDVLAAMLVENGQRRDLNPMEEARGLRRLQIDLAKPSSESGLAPANEVARKVGRSQAHVSGRLALLSLSAEDQAAIIAGDMSLLEGTTKGRLNSGRVGQKGVDRNWHLGPLHPLAEHAKARCKRLQHSRGRTVGGMACGECWESVIRADARRDFVDLSHKTGNCAICEQPVERQVEPVGAGR